MQAERQQDTLYGVEFQLVVLERKMARAQGIISHEEAERLIGRMTTWLRFSTCVCSLEPALCAG